MGLREEKVLPLGFYPCSSWFVHTLFTLALSLLLLKRNNYKRLLAGKVLGLFFFSPFKVRKKFLETCPMHKIFLFYSRSILQWRRQHIPILFIATFCSEFKDVKLQCTWYRNVHHYIITVEFNVNAAVEICESHSSTSLLLSCVLRVYWLDTVFQCVFVCFSSKTLLPDYLAFHLNCPSPKYDLIPCQSLIMCVTI